MSYIECSEIFAAFSEILHRRLYFATCKRHHRPSCTSQTHFFSVDKVFVYENFVNDFGPLNICMLYKYCQILNSKLTSEDLSNKRVVHYTSIHPEKRLNAACLIGSYAVIYLKKTPQEAYSLLTEGETPAYTLFRDASNDGSCYKISLLDCLNAVHKAMNAGFFNFNDFDAKEYEFYEEVENGDLNWIVPQKFIAFCGPHQKSKTFENGFRWHAPKTYFDYFHQNNVTTVIRLNAKAYEASLFREAGFAHEDLYFVDGSTPCDDILKKFLLISETNKGAIAVHCKAGLGRTGSLIGAYMMKHYHFTALEAIAWLRLCRPGSVLGHQQQWMKDKQESLWLEGELLCNTTNSNISRHEFGIYSASLKDQEKLDKMTLRSEQKSKLTLRVSPVEQNANTNRVAEMKRKISKPLNASEASGEPKLASKVECVHFPIEKSVAPTQGDKLNQLKALRRHRYTPYPAPGSQHHMILRGRSRMGCNQTGSTQDLLALDVSSTAQQNPINQTNSEKIERERKTCHISDKADDSVSASDLTAINTTTGNSTANHNKPSLSKSKSP